MNEKIITAIRDAIPDAKVFVESPDGTHFTALVVSESFTGQTIVRQHQAVMKTLRSHFDSEALHALQLKTMTPVQYQDARSAAE